MTQPESPAAGGLGQADLVRITGADAVQVLRLRQRPGRSVLHVSLRDAQGQETGQGAIWRFAGDKAGRVARRHPASAMDPVTNAVFDRFPADHRLPEIAAFVHWVTHDAPFSQRAATPPALLRYRPGLSCTFGITQRNGERVFSKIIADEDVSSLARRHVALAEAARTQDINFIRPIRAQPEFKSITYERAKGRSFLDHVRNDPPEQSVAALRRVVAALQSFPEDCSGVTKSLLPDELRRQSERCTALISDRCRHSAALAQELLNRMAASPPEIRTALIHADMKTDHVFLTAEKATFIDTESMAAGDPRYDLACLEASLIICVIRKELSGPTLAACRGYIRSAAGQGYDWFLNIARLKAARHFAQRPGDENLSAISRAMEL